MAKQIKLIIGEKKPIQTQVGADINYANVPTLSSRTDLLKALGLQRYYYHTLNADNPQDTVRLQQVADFGKALGVPVGIGYPFETAIINTEFPKWLDTIVKILNPDTIGAGTETVRVEHGTPITNEQLVSLTQQIMTRYPLLRIIWDGALIQREAEITRNGIKEPNVDMQRNLAIAAVPGAKEIRQYFQLSPEPGSIIFNDDQPSNYLLIRNFYDVTFPTRQAAFQTRFSLPGRPVCREAITQYNTEDTGTQHLTDALTNYDKGEMVRSILSNTEFYSILLHFAENNLVTRDNKPTALYTMWKRLIPAFTQFKYVMPVTFPWEGMTGVGLWDGLQSYGLLANNSTSIEHPVKASDIKIWGTTVTGNLSLDSGAADSWTSPLRNSIVTLPTVNIGGCGTNLITFKTGAVT